MNVNINRCERLPMLEHGYVLSKKKTNLEIQPRAMDQELKIAKSTPSYYWIKKHKISISAISLIIQYCYFPIDLSNQSVADNARFRL